MRIIIILLLTFGMNAQTLKQTWGNIDPNTKHFYGTTLIYQVTNQIVLRKTESNFKANLSGILTSGVISILGKEFIYDKWMKKGTFSEGDIFIDSWAIACNVVVSIPLNAAYISNQEEKRELEKLIKSKQYE